jgi:hypothetical protein
MVATLATARRKIAVPMEPFRQPRRVALLNQTLVLTLP